MEISLGSRRVHARGPARVLRFNSGVADASGLRLLAIPLEDKIFVITSPLQVKIVSYLRVLRRKTGRK